jgi:outer membrane protein
MEDARRELAVRTTQALSAARSGLAKVRALEEALRSAQESASAGRRGLEIGVRNLLEVLDAEQRTYDIARDLIRARQEYVLSWLQLKASAGLLREADLAEINSQLVAPSAPAATDQGDAATN